METALKENEELRLRNEQLAKVSEIAFNIDSARTVEKVLGLVVESARDIPGICFAMALKLDESQQCFTAQYYSRIRKEAIHKILLTCGLNLDEQLGKSPTSKKLRLPLDKLNLAQDYLDNPRVIIKDSLDELFGGIWPNTICNTIQKVLNVERFIVVPLFIDGKSWGNLLFFLDGDISQDILEMIGMHCTAAIKNVTIHEVLSQRNAELLAISTTARQTSTSRDFDELLSNSINEVMRIFGAASAAIYLLNENGQTLELAAHHGTADMFLTGSKPINLDSTASSLSRFFASDKRVITGNLCDYSSDFPVSASRISNAASIPFITVILGPLGHCSGMMTVVRDHDVPFKETEQALLLSIANQISIAIDNARMHVDVLKRMEEAEKTRDAFQRTMDKLTDSEERLQRTVEAVSEGIIVTDLDGNVRLINEAVLRMHGYSRKADIVDRSAFELIAEKDQPLFVENLKKTLKNEHSGLLEYTSRRKDGQEFRSELNANLVKDSYGKPLSFVFSTRDITERIRAEEEIRQSEKHYRLLAENLTDVIWTADINNPPRFTYISPSVTRLLGFTIEEAMAREIEVFTPASLEILMKSIAEDRTVEERTRKDVLSSRTLELDMYRKDGQIVPVEININFIKDTDGRPVEVLVVARDITQRKQAEERVLDSEQYLRTLLDSFSAGALLIDPETHTIIDVNTSAVNMFGVSKDEILGHLCHRFVCLAEVGKCPVTDLGQTVNVSERILLNAKGQQIPVLKSVSHVTWQGRKYLFESFIDITQHKEAETALKQQKELIDRILSTTPDAVLVIGEELKIKLANRTFCDIFKKSVGEVVGKSISKIIPGEELLQEISKVATCKKSDVEFEFKYKFSDQEITFIANILQMQKGEVLLILDDVTKERERQDKLFVTDRLATIGEMAAGLAHEINNPLTGVIGLSQLVMQSGISEDVRQDVESIFSEAKRASNIVKNLLLFSRQQSVEMQPTDVNIVIKDVLRLREYEEKVNNIEVITKLEPDLPATISNSLQLQQVFLNLVLNAEQAMLEAHREGTLTVTTERVDGNIKVSFSDNGPGITPENLKKLFSPFFTTKEVGKGTGLGLSVCYGIVTDHRGNIYARSENGEGTTFVVELPVNGHQEK